MLHAEPVCQLHCKWSAVRSDTASWDACPQWGAPGARRTWASSSHRSVFRANCGNTTALPGGVRRLCTQVIPPTPPGLGTKALSPCKTARV